MASNTIRHRIRAFAERWLVPYLPYPHFMCVAPLDAVLRVLWYAEGKIPPAYWPRLVLLLLLSGINTVASLPERVILWAWLRLRPPRMERDKAPVFVLGYFRSGTTFLQNLLAADPNLRSPSWPQVLAPQTFVLGWALLRYLFVPLLPLTRLDAVVPMGAKLPAEDDFALNNLGGMSILAGRAVLPHRQAFFNRFHDLLEISDTKIIDNAVESPLPSGFHHLLEEVRSFTTYTQPDRWNYFPYLFKGRYRQVEAIAVD